MFGFGWRIVTAAICVYYYTPTETNLNQYFYAGFCLEYSVLCGYLDADGGGPVKTTETLSIYIYKLAFNSSKYALASATSVIVLIICIIIAVFYVRQQKKARE